MSGTRGGIARIVAMGIALALALLLLAAREATAGSYRVVQCGWYAEADADWADTTGGAKFRQDRWCVPPSGADPFAGVHLKSFTKGGPTVSGTRFARWRWVVPAGTGITRVDGVWWHALHDGMEQRLGAGNWSGGFDPFLSASTTDTTPRHFSAEFALPQPAIEDRLLCARPESRSCSLDPASWSAVQALLFDVYDGYPPVPGAAGAELAAPGWHRGTQRVNYWDTDVGGGVRWSETLIDGARVGLSEYECSKAWIDGEWRSTRMQPCPSGIAGEATVRTTDFSDGPHELKRCATDFAGNPACLVPTVVLIDNHPPSGPRSLAVSGGEGWHRIDDFDVRWVNPDQGRASPIGAAYWRITGPSGYDTGIGLATGRDIAALADRKLPRSGVYSLRLWLRDEAGNVDSSTAAEIQLRLDDVPPQVAFVPVPEPVAAELPATVSARVSDAHSGPAGGTISFRRLNSERWIELRTRIEDNGAADAKRLVAPVPADLAPGTYAFRAEVRDAAGNSAVTTRHADGAEMALRKVPAPAGSADPAREQGVAAARPAARPAARSAAHSGRKTRLFAHLRWRRRRGQRVTVPFAAGAMLSGRLVDGGGVGLAGRRLRVVSRFSRGALARRRVAVARSGRHGGFRLALPAGPSRRVTVVFRGGSGLSRARRPALALRVRGAATLRVAPPSLRTGQSVKLWGRVRARGAPLPRRGKLVAIQYYENEARLWRPVLVTRSDHGGRFHARYRFRYIEGAARIRLRAVALAEERWPYAPGASRSVLVRVSGGRPPDR